MTDPDDIMRSDDSWDKSEIDEWISNEYGAKREQMENLSFLNINAHSYLPHDHTYANGKIIVSVNLHLFGVRLKCQLKAYKSLSTKVSLKIGNLYMELYFVMNGWWFLTFGTQSPTDLMFFDFPGNHEMMHQVMQESHCRICLPEKNRFEKYANKERKVKKGRPLGSTKKAATKGNRKHRKLKCI